LVRGVRSPAREHVAEERPQSGHRVRLQVGGRLCVVPSARGRLGAFAECLKGLDLKVEVRAHRLVDDERRGRVVAGLGGELGELARQELGEGAEDRLHPDRVGGVALLHLLDEEV
jgi:hypothetical protein